jgi:hypothetical protein
MAREVVQDAQMSMDGGLNTVSDVSALQPNQLRRTENARLTDVGAITKRGGTQRLSTAAIAAFPVANGFTWNKADGTSQIMAVVNGGLYTTTFASLPMAWTARSGALSTSTQPAFSQFRDSSADVVYISDGGLLNKWNGTTLTVDIADTVNSDICVVHNQRLWSAGNASFPNSIFYSSLNNGDTLGNGSSGGGQIVVRTFGNEGVVGLVSLATSLLIFHRRGVSRLTGYGQDDITVSPAGIASDVGLIAPKSIVPVGSVAYFISERGMYRCNEAEVAPVATVQTPDPLLPILRSLSTTQFSQIRAGINRATRELWITIPTVGCYQYHTLLQSWSGPWNTGWISPDTTALFEASDTSGLPIMLRGDASGWVSRCDAPSINMDNVSADGTGGTAYSMVAQLRRMYCGDEAMAKAYRYAYLTAQLNGSASCSVGWSTGTIAESQTLPPSTSGTWGVGTWTTGASWSGASSQNYRVQMGGTGYYVDISIIDTSTYLPTFSRFQLQTFALGRR